MKCPERLSLAALVIVLSLGLIACSDDPASVNPEDAPTSPTMEHVELDLEIFEQAQQFSMEDETLSSFLNSSALAEEDSGAYERAASFAWFADFYFSTMAAWPQTYFQENQWGEPTLEGDTWVWEFSWSHEGESLTMRVTANEIGPATHWELRYSYSGSEENVDNALLIAAQVNHDGQEGSWQMYNFDENEEIFNINYQLDGDITTEVDMDISQDDDARVLYQHNGTTSSLDIWDSGEHHQMHWNSDTGTGYIVSPGYQDGEQVCWDSSFQNTEC